MTVHFSPRNPDVTDRTLNTGLVHTPSSRDKTFYRSKAKHALDVILTVLALPVAVPLILILAALVALDGHSPLYSQQRLGRNGKHFRIWKLRTMVHKADRHLESYLERNSDARQEWKTTQKLKNDPRITRVGRLLRKTSMDELPQLWNVLNGTMSLVGPRPMMPTQRSLYPGQNYFSLKPGITGLWQISDRNNCEFSSRAYYDDLYEKTVSLKTDISILLRTVGVVLRGTGY